MSENRGFACLGEAISDRDAIEIVASEEKAGASFSDRAEPGDKLAVAAPVLRQTAGPLPHPGDRGLPSCPHQLAEVSPRHADQIRWCAAG